MDLSNIIPVLALLLGWFLNEVTRHFGIRREKQKAVSQAIADLLEIRHGFVSIRMIVEEIAKRFQLSPEKQPEIKEFFKSIFPHPTANFNERYDSTVTLIASSDPILGFRLRSKNLIGEYLSNLSALVDNDAESQALFSEYEAKLQNILIPDIEENILDLAKQHSLVTWFRVRHLLNRKQGMPKELDKLLREMEEKLK